MRKLPIFILLVFLLQSCLGDSPMFILYNKSNNNLDSVVIGVSKNNPSILLNIKREEKANGKILFDNTIKGDGDYFIEIYNKNRLMRKKRFGYYTNGQPLNSTFKLTVLKDSILVTYN